MLDLQKMEIITGRIRSVIHTETINANNDEYPSSSGIIGFILERDGVFIPVWCIYDTPHLEVNDFVDVACSKLVIGYEALFIAEHNEEFDIPSDFERENYPSEVDRVRQFLTTAKRGK